MAPLAATAERGVRVVPHPGRHGPDGRPYEDDVGQRDGAAALPQPRHLLQPARHGHAVPPLLRRPHRRLRRGTYHTCGLALSLEWKKNRLSRPVIIANESHL